MTSEQQDSKELRGVVIPSVGVDLLLPNASVAEVATLEEPFEADTPAPWLLGHVEWRGLDLPVVVIGAGKDTARSALAFSRIKLVICYTPSGNEGLPYVGVCSIGMPHLALLRAEDLLPPVVDLDIPLVLEKLIYQDNPACIPDLDGIAERILALSDG